MLFFILLVFLVVGCLRVYQGRRMTDVLTVFAPTLAFVFILICWAALRANLSNRAHSSSDLIKTSDGLSAMVAANGLIGCAALLLNETIFQVFGLFAKRTVETARRWVRYTSYAARLANLIALIMSVVASCDFASCKSASDISSTERGEAYRRKPFSNRLGRLA